MIIMTGFTDNMTHIATGFWAEEAFTMLALNDGSFSGVAKCGGASLVDAGNLQMLLVCPRHARRHKGGR